MCIHTAVLREICRSNSSVDVDSILVGHTICIEIQLLAFKRSLMILSTGQSTMSCTSVHMVESTINLALPTFQFPFCLYENCCTSCAFSRGKHILLYPVFTDFYLVWLTLWLRACSNTSHSGVLELPHPFLALNCHRLGLCCRSQLYSKSHKYMNSFNCILCQRACRKLFIIAGCPLHIPNKTLLSII